MLNIIYRNNKILIRYGHIDSTETVMDNSNSNLLKKKKKKKKKIK